MSAARWVPTLEDYVDIATNLLAASPESIRRLPRLALAESAIHAPFASFGETEAYSGLEEQAAFLVQPLVQNHPLPDGNKRAAFLVRSIPRRQRRQLVASRRRYRWLNGRTHRRRRGAP